MYKYIVNFKNLLLFILFGLVANVILALYFRMYSYVAEIATSHETSKLLSVTVLSILIVLGLFCFFSVIDYIKWRYMVNASRNLRNDIMKRILTSDYKDYFKEDTSYYTSLLLNDVAIIEENYFSQILKILEESIQLCVMIAFVSIIEWRYIPVVFLFTLPSVLQPFVLKGKLGKVGLAMSLKYENYTKRVRESIENIETIKLFQRENVFMEKFSLAVTHLEKIKRKRLLLNSFNNALMLGTMYFLKVGIALFFVNSAIKGIVSLAVILVLFGLANQIGNPISEILGSIAAINESSEVRRKLLSFLESVNKNEGLKDQNISFNDAVKYENVCFSYPNQSEPVLDDFSVTFKKGKKYLILGESGAGKSTIIRLLAGYYRDYKGKIYIDGFDINKADGKALRDKIALINQNSFVFNGTIRDNVTLYDSRYSDEQVIEAVKQAGLITLITSLQNGIDSVISEKGANFSGGEKQRFAVARAILANKEILLMDEGTSGLDKIASMEIERNILSTDKTVIVIAHRIHETICEYDKIGILDNKRLIAFESYIDLLDSMKDNRVIGDLVRTETG